MYVAKRVTQLASFLRLVLTSSALVQLLTLITFKPHHTLQRVCILCTCVIVYVCYLCTLPSQFTNWQERVQLPPHECFPESDWKERVYTPALFPPSLLTGKKECSYLCTLVFPIVTGKKERSHPKRLYIILAGKIFLPVIYTGIALCVPPHYLNP